MQEVVLHHPLQDMREGEQREAAVVLAQAQRLHARAHVRADVVVRQHDALGLARRARRV